MNKFTLKILWLNYNIGCAIDHIADQGYSPLTSYFFWPRHDAWYQIKTELDSKPWISDHDKITLLTNVTSIINYWQENNKKKSIKEAEIEFPEFIFCGNH